MLLSSPIHLAHHRSTVEPLSLRCRTDIATLSLCCRSDVAPLSHRDRSAVATPMLLRCCAAATPLSQRYHSTVAPLLSLLLLLRSRTAIAPLSRCCRTATAPAQRGYKLFNIELLLLYCHSIIAAAVNHKVHTVVASRSIIRLTVTIVDCQACVSSSSEGCSTSHKTVKVSSC